MECQFSSLCQPNMIRKDPIFKTLMLSRKGTVERPADVNDPLRFSGDGVTFRAKLIGVLEVNAPRGDRLCQEALGELKMAIKAAGEHKQRIIICIALDGLRLRDERTGDCLYHHAVHKISFIAQDMSDPRAFGYIFGSPDQGHRFFGIKTDKHANLVVVAMRDLFQVVYDLKKKDVEKNKQYSFDGSGNKTNGVQHLTDSMDSLDQMLALGSHLNGGRSEMSAIQTADLLNLHAEDKSNVSFDPFATSFTTSMSNSTTKSTAAVPLFSVPPAIPPPPSAAGTLSCGMMNVSQPEPRQTVSDNFSDSFVTLAPPLQLTPIVPPPTKSPKVKVSSSNVSHYSTIRPRKKSGNDKDPMPASINHPQQKCLSSEMPTAVNALSPPASIKISTLHVRKITSEKSPNLKLAATLPRPTSANSSTNSSPRIVDCFDSQPFTSSFAVEPSPAAPTEHVDVFTELDPLGTGRSKPYVDKKDFFQDLKRTSLGSKKLLKQLSTSQVETIDQQHAKDWHAQLSEDPFGSLHFAPVPEADPFDTQFASIAPSLFSAPFKSSLLVESSSPIPTSSKSYSKVSKAINPTSPRPRNSAYSITNTPLPVSTAKSSPSRYPRGSLRVTLPIRQSQSDSDNEVSNVTPQIPSSPSQARRNQHAINHHATNDISLSSLSWSPRLVSTSQRPVQLGSVHNMGTEVAHISVTEDSPLPPLELSSSEEDSSSSSVEDEQLRSEHLQLKHPHSPKQHLQSLKQESVSGLTILQMPPQPPPRPPVLRPPPLPPKGQPPLVPQRPVVTPTDELIYSGHQTPPLPIPVRKPKQPLSVSNSLSRGQNMSRHISREDVEDSHRPVKPIQSKLNQISLLQLSNMSLAELADTLQLPPARLTSMTLTELALRLAELNKMTKKEEVKDETKKTRHSEKKFLPSHSYFPTPRGEEEEENEEEEDDEEEEDNEEEEDDEEEEEEPEPVEVKVDETEICYKGGKKYEILSDVPEPEDVSSTRRSKTSQTTNTQTEVCTSEISKGSDSDRYAALREIMEQDLAVSSTAQPEEEMGNGDCEFANFDDVSQVAYSATQETGFMYGRAVAPVIKTVSPVFGFEDDFSHIQLNRLTESESLYDRTGARPKTTAQGHPSGNSMSSGSVEFDHLTEEDSAVKSVVAHTVWNGSAKRDCSFSEMAANDEEGSERLKVTEKDEEVVIDDLADKFAAFEARFPANPLEGFGDSFADFDLTSNKIVTEPNIPPVLDSFAVDFSSAFNEDKDSDHQLKKKEDQLVKKSTSVNIFSRVDDPFDDDFFQPDLPPAKAISPAPSNSQMVKQPSVHVFNTIVEDPFAWVQPFDDNIQFDDVDDEFTL